MHVAPTAATARPVAARRISRRELVRLFGGTLLAATACRPGPAPVPTVAPSPPSPTPAARLRVGAIVELRDDGRSEGLGRWQGALLGVETVNANGGVLLPGRRHIELELVAYDADRQTDSVPAAMERLTQVDAALATVADGSGAVGEAVGRQADQLGMPTILLDAPRSESGQPARWTHALGLSDVDAVGVLVQFLAAYQTQRIGWIGPRTAAADRARSALVREATRTTAQVVAEERYPAGGEPPPDALARIAFAGAQVIVGWPGNVAEAAALARLTAERARGVTLYLGPVAATPAFLSRVGEAATGVRTIGSRLAVPDYFLDDDPLTAPARRFLTGFRQRFGATPSVAAAGAWDAVRLIAAAAERSGTDRAALRDAMGRTDAFSGASGWIDFSGVRRNGLDGGAFVVARAERGAWVLPP